MIQYLGRDAYKQFWSFSKEEKENLATRLAIELPALRGKVGASQEEIASAVGISRQTYSAYENRTRPIPWSLFLALLFYFDYIPCTHYMIRQLELFPNCFIFSINFSLLIQFSSAFNTAIAQSATKLSFTC